MLSDTLRGRIASEICEKGRSCLQQHDVLVRMGGNEFVFVLPHVQSSSEVNLLAENILDYCNSLGYSMEQSSIYDFKHRYCFYEEAYEVKELLIVDVLVIRNLNY
ncbi:diguanylate cyclase domain-containing protein [Paenibacillus illinoisensis]|uniref:diguanylate cyclase domain-containing protein n=1 Tax=Paenibacillus illinoisensis TaxID=59845 RepID=UPI003AFA1D57